jgi:hypothetical protein
MSWSMVLMDPSAAWVVVAIVGGRYLRVVGAGEEPGA